MTSIEEALAEARARIERFEPDEAHALAQNGAVLVDLRSHDERAHEGVIPGSIHVPRSVLEWRVDPDSGYANPRVAGHALQLALVCKEGYSSSLAAAELRELGFARAADLAGGFDAWRDAGLATIPAVPPPDGLPGMGGPDR
jgi:rhodanese-related sulfurtransferase